MRKRKEIKFSSQTITFLFSLAIVAKLQKGVPIFHFLWSLCKKIRKRLVLTKEINLKTFTIAWRQPKPCRLDQILYPTPYCSLLHRSDHLTIVITHTSHSGRGQVFFCSKKQMYLLPHQVYEMFLQFPNKSFLCPQNIFLIFKLFPGLF